jgi:3-oxoacyl-[acyl-carrier-protein] synthase II
MGSMHALCSRCLSSCPSAASQALSDSGWSPSSEDERDRSGVAIGSGIGSVEDSSEAGLALYTKGHKK